MADGVGQFLAVGIVGLRNVVDRHREQAPVDAAGLEPVGHFASFRRRLGHGPEDRRPGQVVHGGKGLGFLAQGAVQPGLGKELPVTLGQRDVAPRSLKLHVM